MARRPVIVFLVKVVPLFLVIVLLWQALGFSAPYHKMIARFLDAAYPHFDPTGTVIDADVRDGEFIFRVVAAGKRMGIAVNAVDITSNFAMLLALYLASPFRRRVKSFLIFLGCSLVLLFAFHVVTVVTVSQEALMQVPAVMASEPFSPRQIRWIPRYNVFCEEMGMYLVVLLLWFPYILRIVLERREDDREVRGAESSTT